jgi:DNA gyrase/topoisomerase IV subunit A
MIHPDDVSAWIAQVRQQPEAAPEVIRALAERLLELDQQNEALRDELLRLRHSQTPNVDTSRVSTLNDRIQILERQLSSVQAEPVEQARYLLALTLDGRGVRFSLPAAQAWREREAHDLVAEHLSPRHLLLLREEGELLLFSDKGRAVRVSVAEIDATQAPAHYLSPLPKLMLDLDESISVAAPMPLDFERLTLVTRKGYIRSFRRAELHSFLERNLPLHSTPVQGDYPAFVAFSQGRGELLIVTRMGQGVRFPERAVGVQSKPALKLDRGDVLVGMMNVDDQAGVVLVGESGEAVRREMAGFGAHPNVGNRGKVMGRLNALVAAMCADKGDDLWLLTAAGKLLSVPVARVPSGPGPSKGRTVVQLDRDRLVALTVDQGA